MRRRAFTLIELLVVIAIIAILAAILFPVFAKAREKARQSSCQSNLKQLSLGVTQYAQDYDETYPRHYWQEGQNGVPNSTTWWGGIFPYVKNVQLYSCPSRNSNGSTAPNSGWTHGVWLSANPAFNGQSNHYGYNEPAGNLVGGLKLADVRFPSELLMLGDCVSSWGGGYGVGGVNTNPGVCLHRYAYAKPGYTCGCPLAAWPSTDYGIHNAGGNVGFADGHVKWIGSLNFRTTNNGGGIRYFSNEW